MVDDVIILSFHVFHLLLELVVSFLMRAFIFLEIFLPYLVILDILETFLFDVFLQITYLLVGILQFFFERNFIAIRAGMVASSSCTTC